MAATATLTHLFTELSSLDDLGLPLKKGSARLRYTCMCVSHRYICLGSNTGGVYVFSRDSLKHLQIVFGDLETSPVTAVAVSPNDLHLALAVSSGQVVVMELNIERRTRPERLRHTLDHLGATVTAMVWDGSGSNVFVGDSQGKVTVINVPSSKAKTIFTQPSQTIVRLDSIVYQLDWWGGKLLVSTLTRTYLLNTTKQQFSQIGKKAREGEFGSCFFLEPSSNYPVIYCARPGSRMWEVDFEGNVLNTHQFKQLLATQPLPIITSGVNLEEALHSPCYGAQSVNFQKMFRIGEFILTWSNRGLYVFDPINVKVVLWTDCMMGIKDISLLKNEVYVLLDSQLVRRLVFLPLFQLCSALVTRPRCVLAANLLLYMEHFSLRPSLLKRIKRELLALLVDHLKAESQLGMAERVQAMLEEVSEGSMDSIDSLEDKNDRTMYPVYASQTSGIIVVNDGSTSVLDFENHARSRGASPSPFSLVEQSAVRNGVSEEGVQETTLTEQHDIQEMSQHAPPSLQDPYQTRDGSSAETVPHDNSPVSVRLSADSDVGNVAGNASDEGSDSHALQASVINEDSFTNGNGLGEHAPENVAAQPLLTKTGTPQHDDVQKLSSSETSAAGLDFEITRVAAPVAISEAGVKDQVLQHSNFDDQNGDENIPLDGEHVTISQDGHGGILSSPGRLLFAEESAKNNVGAASTEATCSDEEVQPLTEEVPFRRTISMPHLTDAGESEGMLQEKEHPTMMDNSEKKSPVAARKDSSGSDTGLVVRIKKKKKRRHVNVVDIPSAGSSSGSLKRSYSTGTLKQKKRKELRHGRSLDVSPERIQEDGLYVQTDADPDTVSIATISSIEEEEGVNEDWETATPTLTRNSTDDVFSCEDGASKDTEQDKRNLPDSVRAADADTDGRSTDGPNSVLALDSVNVLKETSAGLSVGSRDSPRTDDDDDCDVAAVDDGLFMTVVGEAGETEVTSTDFLSNEEKLGQHVSSDGARNTSSAELNENAVLKEHDLLLSDSSLTSSYEHPQPKSAEKEEEIIPPLIERLSAMGVARSTGWGEDSGVHSQDLSSMRDRLTGASRRSISSMKDRVTKISSTTRSLIRRVKEKNPLVSRSPSSSPPFQSAMVSGSPTSQSGQDMGGIVSSLTSQPNTAADSQEFPDTTVNIDLTGLLSKTEQTEKELSSPCVLLDQEKLRNVLNSWAWELNKTLVALHQEMNSEAERKRREKLAEEEINRKAREDSEQTKELENVDNNVSESPSETKEPDSKRVVSDVSDFGSGDVGSPVDPVTETGMDGLRPPSDDILENERKRFTSVDSSSVERSELSHPHVQESVVQGKDSELCNGLSASVDSEQKLDPREQDGRDITDSRTGDDLPCIERDWEKVCHVHDPFHLPPQQHVAMSTIAAHCFECGCFGNARSVFSPATHGPKTVSTSPQASATLSSPFSDTLSEGEPAVQLQGGKVVRRQGTHTPLDTNSTQRLQSSHHLPSTKRTSPSQLVPSGTGYPQNSSEKFLSGKNSSNAELSGGLVDVKVLTQGGSVQDSKQTQRNEGTGEIAADGLDALDAERALFVRLFYHLLPYWRIRRLIAETEGTPVFKTWRALVMCCQALGAGDIVWMKIDARDVTGSLDYLRSGILPNKSAFLGHIASLFGLSPMRVADFAAEVPRQVTLRDMLHLCELHGKSQSPVLTRYITQRLGSCVSYMRPDVVKQLAATKEGKLAVLECLLSIPSSQVPTSAATEMRHMVGGDNKLSPEVVGEALDSLLSLVQDSEVERAVAVCQKYRYWPGCLRLLTQTDQWQRVLQLEVELNDISLLDGSTRHGFTPRNLKEWTYLMHLYKQSAPNITIQHRNPGQPESASSRSNTCSGLDTAADDVIPTPAANSAALGFSRSVSHSADSEYMDREGDLLPKNFQSSARGIVGGGVQATMEREESVTDSESTAAAAAGCGGLSWMSLGLLAAKHVGTATAVELLQGCGGAGEGADADANSSGANFSDEFYHTCIALSSLERQQRLVIHNMLEKVDSYLWAKKPVHLSPQMHYAVSHEKTALRAGNSDNDYYQNLFARLASAPVQTGQLAEDPDCHWGVNTSIVRICAGCQVSVTETVSHLEPGAYIFKCGHVFHKFCAADKFCPLC